MAMKRAFISFDFDNDNDLRGNLVAQAQKSDSPFNIADWSVKEPFDENWRKRVRDLIRKTDLTIVICGEHTHQAKGVEAEVTMVQQVGKPYFLLKGRRHKTSTRPKSVPKKKKIHPWTWTALKELTANPR